MRKILASYLNHLVALAVKLRKSNTVCLISCRARKERDWCHHSARQIQCRGKNNVFLLFLCSRISSFQCLQYIQCKGWKLEMPCTQTIVFSTRLWLWEPGTKAMLHCAHTYLFCYVTDSLLCHFRQLKLLLSSSLYVLCRCTSQRWRLIWPSTWTTKTSGAFPSTHHDSHSPSHTPRPSPSLWFPSTHHDSHGPSHTSRPSPSLWLCEKQKGKVTGSWARALERVQCSPIPCIVW